MRTHDRHSASRHVPDSTNVFSHDMTFGHPSLMSGRTTLPGSNPVCITVSFVWVPNGTSS